MSAVSESTVESVDPAPGRAAGGPAPGGPAAVDWGLIGRQIGGIFRLELKRNLFGRRALALYFLAFSPVLLLLLWAISPAPEHLEMRAPMDAVPMFGGMFELYLRTSIFLSALILFMSLFRSEILQRSLHYYLLTPVRRETLVVGKYLTALAAACAVFALATAALFAFTFVPWGVGELFRFLFQGPGLGNLVAYTGIAVLGCAGYGAVFLLMGLFFRNPVVAAVIIWGWEAINFLLPPLLKKVSVIFYLQSLYPVPLPAGIVTVLGDPISAWISVPGFLVFTALVLALASFRARRMEISYGGD